MFTLSPPHHHLLLRGLSSASTTTCRAVATPNPCISDTPDTAPTPSRNRNKNKNAVPDPALRSTWAHRAWVAAGSAAVLAALSNSASAAADSGSLLEPALAAALGYVLADLGSGFYHFGIDNYGGPSTPVFGPQIEAFQGHHRRPATITRRQPANNLHALARAVALAVVPLELAVGAAVPPSSAAAAAAHAFVGACAGCIMLSQQFHAWAHGAKGRVPHWVEALQGAGVLISRDMHGAHHRVPYNNNYCIVSGVWNPLLDEYRVFEAVELVLYFRFGVRPRSWGETAKEWKEEEEEDIL
ncbi:fatty acid desaturase 4, chloroplastic [Iris pallida]|uniref:Fatty acid desaturase 4, chloroplastic n=1 Tax=Iris pallida TaxID=29817 RepID=A0AAX6HAA0_IRIPA|nr:fatty acid desaturase 4, chloroplastic [Iris pallida]